MYRINKSNLLESLRLMRKYNRTGDIDIYRLFLDSFDVFKYEEQLDRKKVIGLKDLIHGALVIRPNMSNDSVYALLESMGISVVDGDAQ